MSLHTYLEREESTQVVLSELGVESVGESVVQLVSAWHGGTVEAQRVLPVAVRRANLGHLRGIRAALSLCGVIV